MRRSKYRIQSQRGLNGGVHELEERHTNKNLNMTIYVSTRKQRWEREQRLWVFSAQTITNIHLKPSIRGMEGGELGI